MRLRPALRALGARWRHPALWLGAVVLPLVQMVPLARVPRSGPWTQLPLGALLMAAGAGWGMSILMAGLPFQWTGDDRPQAGFWRGFAQWCALELLLLGATLPILPWNLPPREQGVLVGALIGSLFTSSWLLLLLNWLLVRAETEDAEVAEFEQRARAAERLVARQTLSPRTIHDALASLLAERVPASLERGLVDLAVLFRTRLMLQTQPTVPFAQERQLVAQLIHVLQRTGRMPRLVHQAFPPELDPLPVPSLAVVQLVEILADLAENCPLEALGLEGIRTEGSLEVRLRWHGPQGGCLLAHLEAHADFQGLERRLAGTALLREPLSFEHGAGGGSLCLRLPLVPS